MRTNLALIGIIVLLLVGSNWYYGNKINKMLAAQAELRKEHVIEVAGWKAKAAELTDKIQASDAKGDTLLSELRAKDADIISLNRTIVSLQATISGDATPEIGDEESDTTLHFIAKKNGISMEAWVNCATKRYTANLIVSDLEIDTYLAYESGVFVTYSSIVGQDNGIVKSSHTSFSTSFFKDLYNQKWHDKIAIEPGIGSGSDSVLFSFKIGYDCHHFGVYALSLNNYSNIVRGLVYSREFYPFR